MSARRAIAVLAAGMLAGCSGILGITDLDSPSPDDAGSDAHVDAISEEAHPGADGGPDVARDATPLPDGSSNPLQGSCSVDGWCWVNPLPGANDLDAVWGMSTDDLWAVGRHGTVIHYHAGTLTKVDVGTRLDLSGVWGASADDFWVVGDGIILRNKGGTWSSLTTQASLWDVRGSGPSDIYATGAGALHYDGTAWSNLDVPNRLQIWSVWPTARGDVWGAGDNGTLVHYHELEDGGPSWTAETPGFQNWVSAVWALNAEEAWAVGPGGAIARHTDAGWTFESSPTTSNLNAIAGTSAKDIWGVGSTSVHYDGARWVSIDTPAGDLQSVYTPAPGDAWAVGSLGAFLHFSNGAWTSAVHGTQVGLRAIGGTSDDDVWLFGERATVLHWDGKQLASVGFDNVGETFTSLYVAPSGEIWAAGTGGLAAYRSPGGRLARGSISANHNIWSMWGSAANDLWAVGDGGEIDHYDGMNWRSVSSPTNMSLRAVTGTSATEVWAVGDGGTILHLTQSGWEIVPSDAGADGGALTADLYAVYSAAPGDVWASGDGPTTLRLVNGVWTKGPDIGFRAASFWGTGPRDIWAVGSTSNVVARFDGTAWTLRDSGATPWLSAAWGTPSGAIWAAGWGGTVLYRAP
jgi:hypothetical protein